MEDAPVESSANLEITVDEPAVEGHEASELQPPPPPLPPFLTPAQDEPSWQFRETGQPCCGTHC
jgi:hypothetical protein